LNPDLKKRVLNAYLFGVEVDIERPDKRELTPFLFPDILSHNN
jgi:hypothetical protein